MSAFAVLGGSTDAVVEADQVILLLDELDARCLGHRVLDAFEHRWRDVDQLVVLAGADVQRPGDGVACLGQGHGGVEQRHLVVLLYEPLFDERCSMRLVQQHEDVSTQFGVLNAIACRPLHDVADVAQAHFVQEQVDGERHGLGLTTGGGDFDGIGQPVEVQHYPLGGGVGVCAAGA